MRKAGANRGNTQSVCESESEREKDNPGGINSSYRNSFGLVSASV